MASTGKPNPKAQFNLSQNFWVLCQFQTRYLVNLKIFPYFQCKDDPDNYQ